MFKNKYTLTTWILLGTNALLIVWIFIHWQQDRKHNQQPQQVSNNINYSFSQNPNFSEQLDLNTLYNKPVKIAMLGNSLTYKVNWNELLERNDIANLGIGSDITAGYLHRIQTVISLHPSMVCIEGGINDIALDLAPAKTLKHIQQLVDTFRQYKITPILHTILPVHANYPVSLRINEKVWGVNQAIIKYATEKHIQLIDLTPLLSANGFLRSDFVQQDGIHLKASAYRIWAQQLKQLIQSFK
ncbi:MAG: hypothetical protein KA198_01610 [Chitinophagaceae bacterium]|nr:hypothetical protein [Chitinophagaceae bacterium]